MTPSRLAEIEARAKAATEGPWVAGDLDIVEPDPGVVLVIPANESWPEGAVCEVWHGQHDAPSNAEFIAHVRQDILDLIARIRELEEKLEQVCLIRKGVVTLSEHKG